VFHKLSSLGASWHKLVPADSRRPLAILNGQVYSRRQIDNKRQLLRDNQQTLLLRLRSVCGYLTTAIRRGCSRRFGPGCEERSSLQLNRLAAQTVLAHHLIMKSRCRSVPWQTRGSSSIWLLCTAAALLLGLQPVAAEKSAADYFIHSLPGQPEGPLLKMHAG
jgi:hypothetical protein